MRRFLTLCAAAALAASTGLVNVSRNALAAPGVVAAGQARKGAAKIRKESKRVVVPVFREAYRIPRRGVMVMRRKKKPPINPLNPGGPRKEQGKASRKKGN